MGSQSPLGVDLVPSWLQRVESSALAPGSPMPALLGRGRQCGLGLAQVPAQVPAQVQPHEAGLGAGLRRRRGTQQSAQRPVTGDRWLRMQPKLRVLALGNICPLLRLRPRPTHKDILVLPLGVCRAREVPAAALPGARQTLSSDWKDLVRASTTVPGIAREESENFCRQLLTEGCALPSLEKEQNMPGFSFKENQ